MATNNNTVALSNIILDDVTCGICLRILHEPISTPCGHSFCKICLLDSFSKTEFKKHQCSICRADLSQFNVETQNVNVVIAGLIAKMFPEPYKERVEEASDEKEDRKNIFLKNIVIGNEHVKMEQKGSKENVHKWTFYVRDLDDVNGKLTDYVERIVVDLHPTFTPNKVELKEEPFQFSRLGWGTFELGVHIFFKPGTKKGTADFNHYLSFQGTGCKRTYQVEFDKRNFPNLKVQEVKRLS